MAAGAIFRNTKLLRQSETLRHIGILFSGKAVVQLIALLSQPVLARLYSPAQFGEFAFFNSLLAILMVAASGRYESGIVLTRRKQHSKRLFQLGQLCLLAYALFVGLSLLVLPERLLQSMPGRSFPHMYLWLLPPLILCAGYWELVHNWLVRFQQYSKISTVLLVQRLLILGGAIVAVTLPLPVNGLIVGLIVGAVGTLALSFYLQKEPIHMPLKGIKTYALHFREFPLFSVPSLYLLLLVQHLPVLWISKYFDQPVTGAYTMAFTLVMFPMMGLMMSAGEVYYQKLAQSKFTDHPAIIRKNLWAFVLMLAPFSLLIFLWGEPLMMWLLGEDWQQAGKIASLLAPLGLFQGISSLLSIPLSVFRKQSVALLLQGLRLLFLFTALALGYLQQDVYLMMKMISLGSFLHLVVVAWTMYPLMKEKYKIEEPLL